MGIYLKNSTGWKDLKEVYLKNSTGWKKITNAYLKTSTGWKRLFSSSVTPSIDSQVEISKSTNSTTKLITLTGTNYNWDNSTGLTYEFERSEDGVSYISPVLSNGTITNPTVSNTKTYELTTSDVTANLTNTYKFTVNATNSTYNTSASSSATLTVEGVRNISSLTNYDQGYNSLSFSWSGGLYANSFMYQYQTYNNDVEGTWSTQLVSESSPVTITSLSPNFKYRVRVKGITGTTAENPGYSGNWAYAVGTTLNPPEPVVVTYPTLTGTAVAKTEVQSSNGSYSNYSSGTSVQSRVIVTTNPALIVQGLTSPIGTVVSTGQTYTVTQEDATNKSYYFYARDAVTALGGTTVYYYYSDGIKSTMGTVTDNFNRTVTGGIGTMSSGFTYSGSSTAPAWSVNGSAGVASATPTASSGPDTWGLRSIEMGGKTDISMSVTVPGNAGGVGLAFWVTGNSNWWSAICYQAPETVTSYNCTGSIQTSTSNPGNEGSGSGDICNKTTFNTYACNQSGSSGSSYPTGVGTGPGDKCFVQSTTSYACDQFGGSSSSSPGSEGTGPGAICNIVSQTLYDCSGSQQSGTSDPGSESSGSGGVCNKSSSYLCSTSSGGSSQTYPSDVGTGSGQVCNVQSSTAYQFQRFDTSSAPAQSTVSTCNVNNVGRAQTGSITFGSFGNVTGYNICRTVTIYTWNFRNTFLTYTWQTRSISGTTTYYWNKRSTTGTTTYTWDTRTTTATVNYQWQTREAATSTLYSTSLRVYEATGSSVSLRNTNVIDSNSIGYLSVAKINLSTSGDTISADLRNSSNSVLGSATSYTPSSPTKSDIFGSAAFGLSKGYSPASSGNQFDNLSIA
jgi:hypothetical protein